MKKSWKFFSNIHIANTKDNRITVQATVWWLLIWSEQSVILFDVLNEFKLKYAPESIIKICNKETQKDTVVKYPADIFSLELKENTEFLIIIKGIEVEEAICLELISLLSSLKINRINNSKLDRVTKYRLYAIGAWPVLF